MAKYFGNIGFVHTTESSPGVYLEEVQRKPYSGEVIKSSSRVQQGPNVNDDIVINNVVSIISDPFADNNYFAIRFLEMAGASWKVTNVELRRPRLLLTLGGVYNGPKT